MGGLDLPSDYHAIGHSDADVLLHAITDAILGATSMGDIGELFPDSDPQFKNIASLQLLRRVEEILSGNRFEIINIDCILVLENPKISSFKNEIRENITTALQIPPTAFNMKGKTKEKIDAVGRGEALECFSAVLISSKE